MNTCTQGLSSEEMARASLRVSMEINEDERHPDKVSICSVAARVLALEQVTQSFGKALAENTRVTTEIKANTEFLIEIVQTGRKVGRFAALMGRAGAWFYRFFVKWITPIIVTVSAGVGAWFTWKGTKT